jgi:hypothetical protein
VITTVHDMTNTQTVVDAPHEDLRRARASSLSLIPTSTGSATAIGTDLSRTARQAHRPRGPRAAPQCVVDRLRVRGAAADHRRRDQRRVQSRGRRAAQGRPRASRHGRWSRSTSRTTPIRPSSTHRRRWWSTARA